MLKDVLESREALSEFFNNINYEHESALGGLNNIGHTLMKFITKGPDETKEIGLRVGRLLRSGDIVGLYGELGSGKTTMVKGMAKALGIDERDIVSASFTIIAEYDTTPPFYHIDLYRIEKASELVEVGLSERLGGDGISVIEWAERAEGMLPEEMITVRLKSIGEEMREIVIEGKDEEDWNNL